MVSNCKHCGREFTKIHKAIFCSHECCLLAHKPEKRIRTLKKCDHSPCSKEFLARPNQRFCSDTCRTYVAHGLNTIPGARERNAIKYAKSCKVFFNTWFTIKDKKHKVVYKCIDCKSDYTAYRVGLGRCRECARRRSIRIGKSKRRARIRHNDHENVDPYIVFERCNWICTYCGIYTPKHLRGTKELNAPEIDHIVPIAKGGQHTYLNTTCACKRCNNIKGDRDASSLNRIKFGIIF